MSKDVHVRLWHTGRGVNLSTVRLDLLGNNELTQRASDDVECRVRQVGGLDERTRHDLAPLLPTPCVGLWGDVR